MTDNSHLPTPPHNSTELRVCKTRRWLHHNCRQISNRLPVLSSSLRVLQRVSAASSAKRPANALRTGSNFRVIQPSSCQDSPVADHYYPANAVIFTNSQTTNMRQRNWIHHDPWSFRGQDRFETMHSIKHKRNHTTYLAVFMIHSDSDSDSNSRTPPPREGGREEATRVGISSTATSNEQRARTLTGLLVGSACPHIVWQAWQVFVAAPSRPRPVLTIDG